MHPQIMQQNHQHYFTELSVNINITLMFFLKTMLVDLQDLMLSTTPREKPRINRVSINEFW